MRWPASSSPQPARPPCSPAVPPVPAPLKRLPLLARQLALLLLAWLFATAAASAQPPLRAHDGVIDLTGPDGTTATHTLRGEWGFAWQRFLAPTSIEQLSATVPVPGSWNAVTQDGKTPGTDGFASYTL